MVEETEEEFKARMAAISSGYKKDRSERKIQLAEEGKALAGRRDPDDVARPDPRDPRYGMGRDMYGRGGYMSRIDMESMRLLMATSFARRHRPHEESMDLLFLLGLADYLNHLEKSFPTERYLREALRYGLGRGGCDSVNITDEEPEHFYTIGRAEPVFEHRPRDYKTVSTQGMKDAITKIDEKYRGFRGYLNQLMNDYRHGRPLGDIHYQLQSFVMQSETRAMEERARPPMKISIVDMDYSLIEKEILGILGSKEEIFRRLYGGMKKIVDESHMMKMEVMRPTRTEVKGVWIEDEIREEKPKDKREWMKFRDHSRNPKRR